MCGIAGIARASVKPDSAGELLGRMASMLRHRGPDARGVLWHARDRVGLAHARLAVVDLTPAGTQPMESPSGRFAICFNGEVYNAPALSHALQATGWRPRGHSDTEVMLAAIEAWGLDGALERFAGMFAFALHDRECHALHLVRDRLGIKPLHWAMVHGPDGAFVAFASELCALLEVPGFDRSPNEGAIAGMLAHGCVTGDACAWRGARKLAPGHRMRVDLASGVISHTCWWNAIEVAAAGIANPFLGSDADAVRHASGLLDDIVREHLVSDVPLGCFLSGGIDSATVAAAIRGGSPQVPVTAYTVGFNDTRFDERANARRTAAALDMPAQELVMSERAMIEAVANMAGAYDEPFADSSQVPTWLICSEMRKHVTVALSGDGGDEAFGGYHRHVHAAGGWRVTRNLPLGLRRLVSGAALALSPEAWDSLARPLEPLLPSRLRVRSPGDSIRKWGRCFGARDEAEAYRAMTVVGDASDSVRGWWRQEDAARLPDFLRRMQFMDQVGYMVDDVLVKVDRASMTHGLEVRVPLLDHRLIEFAWRLPTHMKVRKGRGKWILREVLARRVPATVLDAPKAGFAVPVGAWLRGPLREWASDLLSPRRVRNDSMLDARRVEQSWESIQRGWNAAQHEVWCVLMYLAWSDRWRVAA